MGILDEINALYRQLACAKEPLELPPYLHSHPNLKQVGGKFQLNAEMRRNILCLGMPVDLTPPAQQALQIIAEHGPAGVTQADLSKLMGQDSRNLHYHLRSLCKHQLITRAPVANRKSFTHLLTWSGFEADDSFAAQMTQSSRVVKEQMLGILSQAGTLNMDTLFDRLEGSNPTGQRRRFLRRAVSDLIDEERVILIDTLLSRQPLAAKSISKVPSQSMLQAIPKTNMPLERQVFEAIRATGSTGCTLPELAKQFNLGTKLIYRIYTRLTLEPNKYLILDEDGVTPISVEKHTEFHGKERRHRLFVKEPSQQEVAVKTESDSPFGFSRDSITRIQRQEAIMRMLLPHTIMDIGRTMALRLQQEMNLPHLPDSKTLKRTILAMEEAGMVRCVHVPMGTQGGTRALVMPASMTVDDPRVQEYIHRLRESYIIIPDDDELEEVEEGKSEIKKYSAEKMGYVHGVGQRAKLLHGYILRFECLESTKHLFQEFPIEMFLKIVGMAESSTGLHQFLRLNSNSTLKEIPTVLLKELQQRRAYRHRNVMRQLLELLTDLQLIQVAEGYPAVAYKLPFQYVINREVIFEGHSYALPADFDVYWRALQERKPHPLLRDVDSWRWVSRHANRDASALTKDLQSQLPDLTDEQIPLIAAQHGCSIEEVWQAIDDLKRAQDAKRLEIRQRRAAKFRETMRRKRQAQEEARRMAGDTQPVRRKIRQVEEDLTASWTPEQRRTAVMTFCAGREGSQLTWLSVEKALGLTAGEGRRAFIRNCLTGALNLIASLHIEQEYHFSKREEAGHAGVFKWPPARILLDEFDRIRQSRASLAEHRLVHRPAALLETETRSLNAPLGVELIKAIVCNNGVQYRGSFDPSAMAWLVERGLITDGPVASERMLRGLQAEEPDELEQLAHNLFSSRVTRGKRIQFMH